MGFYFSKETDIYIYGGGNLGRSFYHKLIEEGYCIKGIVDKNARDLINKEEGIIYYSLDEFLDLDSKSESIVIICIHNAVIHFPIAKELYNNGVMNILFVPFSRSIANKNKIILQKCYNEIQFERGEYKGLIPNMQEIVMAIPDVENAIACRGDETVVIWADIASIMGYNNTNYEKKVFVPALTPYVELFRMLSESNGGNAENYLRNVKPFQDSYRVDDMAFLKDRFDLYDEYCFELNRGMDYFINAAAEIKWDKNGFFTIVDGKHRTIFLYTKGMQYAPFRVKKEDYICYINEKILSKIIEHIITAGISSTKYKVEHSAFLEFPADRDGAAFKIVSAVQELFGDYDLTGKSVWNGIPDLLQLSRFFQKSSCRVYSPFDISTLDMLIQQLFYLEMPIKREIESDFYDIFCVAYENNTEMYNLNNVDDKSEIIALFINCSTNYIACTLSRFQKAKTSRLLDQKGKNSYELYDIR